MPERSVFFDEWRSCLQAHYKTFVREEFIPQGERKQPARESLEKVLYQVGFAESELSHLFGEALRVEEAAPDFVPTFQPHPAECQCPSCLTTALGVNHDAHGQPLPADPEREQAKPTTRSMFIFDDGLDDEPVPMPDEVEEAAKTRKRGKKSAEPAAPKPRSQSLF